jgi:DNA polymerase III alpha subunit (gram-positive type)
MSVLDEATVAMPMTEGKQSTSSPNAPHTKNNEEIETTQIFQAPKNSGSLVHQITDSLRDKLNLEAELQGKVEDYVRQVINDLETTLQNLEEQLDKRLANQSAEEKLFWKHKALQEFMVKVQNNTDRFLDILKNMKTADRERLNLPELKEKKTARNLETTKSAASTTKPSLEKTQKPSKADRQKVISLAQQGNPKAIAALTNKFLSNKEINTLVAIRSGCLHVILESTEKWPPKQLVPGLRKYILELKLNHIELVKIHLREPGAKTAIWTKEFPYKTATGSPTNVSQSR